EINRGGVDAIAETFGAGAVVEDVTEMAAAVGAQNLRAAHAKAVVRAFDDLALCGDLGKARPAAARIKFIVRLEQDLAAGGAAVDAGLLGGVIFAGEGAFG